MTIPTHALITGGAGFIGSHLAERLVGEGNRVTVLDNLSTGSRDNLQSLESNRSFHFVEGTVLNELLVRELVAGVDVVYHLAAAVGVQRILERPLESLETNIRGTEYVLKACDASHRRVLIASTSEVYGKNDEGALGEDADRVLGSGRLSRWFYAAAKSIDESFALAYWQERSLPVVIVRFFNTVGARQTGRYGMVVPRFVRQALRNEPITVFGDGEQTRCFTNVHDVVRAVAALMDTEAATGEIVNIGQPIEIRIVDLARRVVELTESRSAIRLLPYDHPDAYGLHAAGYEDMRRRVPDTTKLQRLTGFRPQVPLDDTLRQIIDFELSDGAENSDVRRQTSDVG